MNRNLNRNQSGRSSNGRRSSSDAYVSGTHRSSGRSSASGGNRGSGRSATTSRSAQSRSGTSTQRSAQTRSSSMSSARGRRRVLTEAEKEYYRRQRALARRRKAARKRAYQARAFVLITLILICLLGFKGLSYIANYIDTSRQHAVDAMQDIDIQRDHASIDVTESTGTGMTDAVTADTPGVDGATGTSVLGDGISTNLANGETISENPVGAEAAGETPTEVDLSDPTHVLSNGRYLDITKPMVALTWDDGPKSSVGNHLMDVLEANSGRGTFFVVGERIDKSPDEVKRMVADGHEVGNHSWDHDEKLSKKGVDYIRSEFDKTNQKVQELTGVTPTLARLPGGIISEDVKSTLTMPMILWSIDTLDWKTKNAQSTIDAIQGSIQDGDIILMHELYDATSQACDTVIPWLNQQGYQMVTVSELIRFRQASVAGGNGKQYSAFRPQPTEAAPVTETAAVAASAAAPVPVVESSAAESPVAET